MKQIYLSIINRLNEQADRKRDIIKDITSKIDLSIIHLIACLFWLNQSNDYEHWKTEVRSHFMELARLKNTNKFPTEKDLYIWHFNTQFEKFEDYIEKYVDDTYLAEPNLNRVNYNRDNLIQYLKDYFIWAIPTICQKGYLGMEEVSNKVDELVNIYRNSTIN